MKRTLFLLAIVFISTIASAQNQGKPSKSQLNAQKFANTLYLIENYYVDTTNSDKIVEDAIIAALKELDPHSAYISKKDVQKANEPLVGSFEGIGVTFQLIRDTITVISPVPGGPSKKVGIMAGDQFIKIDGEESTGKKIDNEYVQKHLRGKKGSKVTVSVKRGNDPELIDFEIVRDKIPLNSINAAFMLDNGVGYIKLDRFAQESAQEFKNAFNKLSAQGMTSLVLDLRGNSGGYLNTAVEMVDQFLGDDQLVVFTEGTHQPRQELRCTKSGVYEQGKLVILIDEGSASASEILSGAVQDHDRGIVIGRRSFGKGLVQRPFNLPDGAQIRLTTARYHTPSGRCIQRPYEKGVEDYYKDLTDRMKNGEYFHADSIHFPDSLKYKTENGRIVYGGGGIMPDIFIPADTSFSSKLYTNLVRKGILNRFTTDYALKHRDEMKATYPTFADYNKNFVATDKFVEGLKQAAADGKVEWDDEQFARSEKFIRMQIKALIARNLWEMQQYYEVVISEDDGVQKAMEILCNDKEYNKLLK
ncbi:MAG: S41 family peptidase [Bacteroidales bacterium]|nr:S41 family peptidase [Bacteroidales bacterium]